MSIGRYSILVVLVLTREPLRAFLPFLIAQMHKPRPQPRINAHKRISTSIHQTGSSKPGSGSGDGEGEGEGQGVSEKGF